MLTKGDAKGSGQSEQLNPSAGIHSYRDPPAANSGASSPAQITASEPTEAEKRLTVTSKLSVITQPLKLVVLTVYQVVDSGLASGEEDVGSESPVAGDQFQTKPPAGGSPNGVAFSIAYSSEHIVASNPASNNRLWSMSTVSVSYVKHQLSSNKTI